MEVVSKMFVRIPVFALFVQLIILVYNALTLTPSTILTPKHVCSIVPFQIVRNARLVLKSVSNVKQAMQSTLGMVHASLPRY